MLGELTAYFIDASGRIGATMFRVNLDFHTELVRDDILSRMQLLSNAILCRWEIKFGEKYDVSPYSGDVTNSAMLYYASGSRVNAIAIPSPLPSLFHNIPDLPGLIVVYEPDFIADLIRERVIVDERGLEMGQFLVGAKMQ